MLHELQRSFRIPDEPSTPAADHPDRCPPAMQLRKGVLDQKEPERCLTVALADTDGAPAAARGGDRT
jgi:hypothetical protein